jgi:hypothetical protein
MLGPFYTHFKVRVMLIIEYLTVTVGCGAAIQVLVIYFNLCLGVILNSLSCSFTFTSFLTKSTLMKLRTDKFTGVDY